ncbi:hypothetical protein [Plantactinospora sp. WMMB782]|uniref:hypothetical protein n=1 Tax=Plantactinospora sp. WMMB782 TaxID=3404121 RepID=UPI003B94A7AE
MANLPDRVYELAELSPAEDVLLGVLEARLPEVPSGAQIEMHQTFPFIHLRRLDSFGEWSGDPRFLDDAYMGVYCLVEDPNGDEDAAILSEAVRIVLRDAAKAKLVIPGRGSIVSIDMQGSPRRTSDWATSAGPVQYAELPAGVVRYESRYSVTVRRPRQRPYPSPP